MTGRLAGRTAIVTGASRGLGRATALALAAEGAAVAVVARTEQQWDERLPGTIGETVAAIEAAGGRAVADRGRSARARRYSPPGEEARAALGPITILVNNAAFTAPGRPPKPGAAPKAAKPACRGEGGQRRLAWLPLDSAGRLPPALRHRPVRRLRADAAGLPGHVRRRLRRDHQRHLGGLAGTGDGPYRNFAGGVLPGYGGSKAALEHLTWCAAYDLQRRNIAVNALAPSRPIPTPGPVLLPQRVRQQSRPMTSSPVRQWNSRSSTRTW